MSKAETLLVTGAAGFIGSHFVMTALRQGMQVIGFDALTYAGHRVNLSDAEADPRFEFIHGDLRDFQAVLGAIERHRPQAVIHLAAESHVDNSIAGPKAFLETNILGTFHLLEACRQLFSQSPRIRETFRFIHVSSDEVFGSLGATGAFNEGSSYSPRSPYSATKAGADHLVQAWFHTYGLPTIITNCSNNYGPRQWPEKLIPRMITQALAGTSLTVYGNGQNIRDWIHVEDHCEGLWSALIRGRPGESYCFGGHSERTNLQVVQSLCSALDTLLPRKDGQPHAKAIQFVPDRAGHDFRYAIDDSKSRRELEFSRKHDDFEKAIKNTVKWYLEHQDWLQLVSRR